MINENFTNRHITKSLFKNDETWSKNIKIPSLSYQLSQTQTIQTFHSSPSNKAIRLLDRSARTKIAALTQTRRGAVTTTQRMHSLVNCHTTPSQIWGNIHNLTRPL